ncbi:DUF2157 domain-containing protein [Brevibacillus migulae]|uniref:DUF2157 domain-containing protein n=1 Tax=Brevibacillus migulae TaxID=1644114 RepID=UPI001431010A|nr:DUF2157 domain-containing protein [Brevibacillus migulae]
MNRKKWLLTEAQKWKEEELISAQQYERLAERYAPAAKVNALPILGSVLLGLGVLTFIASNWQGIGTVAKLLIILVSMIAAYAAGDYLQRRGEKRIGIALTMVGVTIYGAGFFLIGQMFQLSSDPVLAFYLWAAGAILLAWYYQSRALTWMSLAILTIAAIYGIDSERSGMAMLSFYLVFAVGMIPLMIRYRSVGMLTVGSLLLMVHALFDGHRWSEGMYAPLLFLIYYVASQLTRKAEPTISRVLQGVSYLASVLYAVLLIFFHDEVFPDRTGGETVYAVLLLLGTVYAAVYAVYQREREKVSDLLPSITVALLYFLSPVPNWLDVSVVMIIVLTLFAIGLVMSGERLRDVTRINLGAIAFGIACFVGYIHFAWDFMDKSLFFLIGGFLLLILSYFGERARRRWVHDARGDQQ